MLLEVKATKHTLPPDFCGGARDLRVPRDLVAFSCRIYRSERGISEQPDERWVREALIEAAT
jgi:hypothetical protein